MYNEVIKIRGDIDVVGEIEAEYVVAICEHYAHVVWIVYAAISCFFRRIFFDII